MYIQIKFDDLFVHFMMWLVIDSVVVHEKEAVVIEAIHVVVDPHRDLAPGECFTYKRRFFKNMHMCINKSIP